MSTECDEKSEGKVNIQYALDNDQRITIACVQWVWKRMLSAWLFFFLRGTM